MIAYIMNKFIYGYVHKNEEILNLLENREICFIPIVNIDANLFLLNEYKRTGSLIFIKKNRKSTNFSNESLCGRFIKTKELIKKIYSYGYGADLNCNFPYKYSTSNGCSNDPCNAFYRGDGLQKEVQSIIKFLNEKNPFISVNLFR